MRGINCNSVKFNNNSQVTPLRPLDVPVVTSFPAPPPERPGELIRRLIQVYN